MNTLIQYIHLHPVVVTVTCGIIVTNAVNALPAPTDNSSAFYKWFFVFSHGVTIQIGRFINKGANGNAL